MKENMAKIKAMFFILLRIFKIMIFLLSSLILLTTFLTIFASLFNDISHAKSIAIKAKGRIAKSDYRS